jgi:hypothetical protein
MLRRGDYVLCNFPFRESSGPGPSPHVVLCAATGRQRDAKFAIVFYTTSHTDYEGTRRPRQYLFVPKTRAIELGQKPRFMSMRAELRSCRSRRTTFLRCLEMPFQYADTIRTSSRESRGDCRNCWRTALKSQKSTLSRAAEGRASRERTPPAAASRRRFLAEPEFLTFLSETNAIVIRKIR